MTCRPYYRRTVFLWLTLALIACQLLAPVMAQDKEFGTTLDAARSELTAVQKAVPQAEDDAQLLELRTRLQDIQSRLQQGAAQIAPQLASLDARIAELGAAPTDVKEQKDIAAQRRSLEQSRAALDGQARFASLLLLETEQAVSAIAAQRRTLFQGRLSERLHSPLGKRFWAELRNEARRDAVRVATATSELLRTLQRVPTGAWIGALVAAFATLVARSMLTRLLLRIMIARQSHPSLRAFTYVVLWTLTSALIARWFTAALSAGTEASERTETLLNTLVACAGFGTYIVTLGATLVATCAPPWRLDVLPEQVASKLRTFPTGFAVVIVLTALVEQVAAAINLSLASTVAIEALMASVLGLVLATYLQRVAPRHFPHWGSMPSAAVQPAHAMPIWASVAVAAAWTVLFAGAVCLLLGYLALGGFIIKQFAWALIVLCTALLLARVLAHAITGLLAPKGVDQSHVGTSSIVSARLQAAVLLSALAQFTVGFFALLLLLAPYGAGPAEFLEHATRAEEGLAIGQIRLRPSDLARAVIVIVLGFAAVRSGQRWLQQRYLPLTRMDTGMRDSVASILTYVGYVVVVSLSLSALGVSLQQIAWVASALAVGIGFGLQAIVQNFVSGLILLAERPVRVGDWVSLGDIEGDVRRINARATEIQKGDRSTVIVPNSEFITKAVRNVTHHSALGLVQFKLPLPLGSDIDKIRNELMQALQNHTDILRDPAPAVMIDGVEGTNVVFNAAGFVRSPRMAYGVRSMILFDALNRLRAAGVQIMKPVAVVIDKHP
ncbi:MAG: DUF3772 domain-containing protein [Steroidobacteraceae bacterium]